jgi:hypothetical protein
LEWTVGPSPARERFDSCDTYPSHRTQSTAHTTTRHIEPEQGTVARFLIDHQDLRPGFWLVGAGLLASWLIVLCLDSALPSIPQAILTNAMHHSPDVAAQ